MDRVARDVLRLALAPRDSLNVYVLGDVLIDSGTRGDAEKIRRGIDGVPLVGLALTHAHVDHQGSSHALCEALDIPLWCGEADRHAAETGDLSGLVPNPRSMLARVSQRMAGPGHPVSRTLRDGDEIGGFRVIETPGHTRGHLAFWREEDRVLVLGDAAFNTNPLTLRAGLREPFRMATMSPERNRASLRRLASLEPGSICFGHGPPLVDPDRFARFVEALTA